ncbi:MAG TPA: hypothetical protein VJX30_01785 [Terriglobales bacterium]|nr:hypothetical protein [Terriglobales bacterium]
MSKLYKVREWTLTAVPLNPSGLCMCGCGGKAPIVPVLMVKGERGSSNSDAVSDAVMEWNDYADKINGKYGSVITPKLSNGENGKGKMF